MKTIEEKAFADGVPADALMEDAGWQIALCVRQFFARPGVCIAAFGKGNNGGDALVAGRHLATWGWDVRLVAAHPDAEWGRLTAKNFAAATGCHRSEAAALRTATGRPLIVLDGLLGIGAKGALEDPVRGLTCAINHLRQTSNARVFALDIPTGLHADTGAADPACVIADFTLTIGFAKQGLIADGAANFVGRLCVLPLDELAKRADTTHARMVPATPAALGPLLPRRAFDSHKGDNGRIGILAGSPGYLGAAVLCSAACVRAGAGLVTLYAAPDVADALARKTPPEIMVRPLTSPGRLLDQRHDVFAIGPGLGRQPPGEIAALVENIPVPVVLDADALNAVASDLDVLGRAAGERILTPHPGEMERLFPGSISRSRSEVVQSFTRRFSCTLLLKGARTLVGKSGESTSFNTTGTPGMAVGGMGDALTGVIAALVGQHVRPFDAARLGAWLCGRASEIAISDGGESEQSLTPTRMLDFLGMAFAALAARCY